MLVQLAADLQWRICNGGQRSQQRLQVGHQDRRRDALSTDVRNGDYQAAVGELKNVVVIPGNPTGRNADRRKIKATLRWKMAWEEGLLDPESEVNLGLGSRQLVTAGLQFETEPIKHHQEDAD